MKITLEECKQAIIEYSSKDPQVIASYLFGSILTDITVAEDIDIAFLLQGEDSVNGFQSSIKIDAGLCQLTGKDHFDVVILNNAPAAFRYDIITNGQLIFCCDEKQRQEFESLVCREYSGFKHYLEYYDDYLQKRMSKDNQKAVFNREIVFQRVNRAEMSLKKLSQLKEISEANFVVNSHNIALTEHYLRVGVDSLVDLSNHIIAVQGLGRPGSSREIGNILGQANIIPMDFIKKCIELIKLRDRLTHLYWEIEPAEVFEVLQKELSNITSFLNYLLQHVENQSAQ
ncbi:MAG: HepT-like ribonuclease domain-containing protein [bacterium]